MAEGDLKEKQNEGKYLYCIYLVVIKISQENLKESGWALYLQEIGRN